MLFDTSGNVGIGATPGTLLELFGTAPYLTLRNSTHEDGDGGRESKIIFEGEQSGGEDSTLAVIQASHDGTSDDQKGDLIFYTNDGSDDASPTERMRIDSAGKVSIGNTGMTASDADNLVVGTGVGDEGITIYAATDGVSKLWYADAASGVGMYEGHIQYEHTARKFVFGAAAATKMVLEGSNGDLSLITGNLVISTAGKGIDFSAQSSPAAGMASELLDRYEEGTWTAIMKDTSDNAMTMNGSYTTGAYTRVGNLVTISGYFIITSLGSASGSIKLTGLPFASANTDTARNGISVGNAQGLNITAGMSIGGYIVNNTSAISLQVWDATTGSTALQATEWTADGQFMISGSYIV